MSARQSRQRFMYALADGTVLQAGEGGNLATVGVVLRDEDHRPVVAFAEETKAQTRIEAQCRSIIAALEAAKMRGAEAVTVYCPNSAIVEELNGVRDRNPDLMKQYLLIKAHLNRFRRSAVREARNKRLWEPLNLARDYALRQSGHGVARTLSLFPTAA